VTATLNPQDILNAQTSTESHEKRGVEDPNLQQPKSSSTATAASAAATNFPDAQGLHESQNSTGVGDSNLQQLTPVPKANRPSAAATYFPDAHQVRESQIAFGVGDTNLQQPIVVPNANHFAAAATNFPDAHCVSESHIAPGVGDLKLQQPKLVADAKDSMAAATNFPDAQVDRESQYSPGVGDSNLQQPIPATKATAAPAAATNFPDAHRHRESHCLTGVGDQATETAHRCRDSQQTSGGLGPILADDTLGICADVVQDLEDVRKANENRLRTLTAPRDQHGHGMSIEHPDVKRLSDIVAAISAAEHQAVLNLQRVIRKHPLGPFVKNSKGVGEKQAARLLRTIGDPYWNELHDRPRKLRELYRFCGMDVVNTSAQTLTDSHGCNGPGVAPSKQRGEKVHWSPDARMRLWLVANQCVKEPGTSWPDGPQPTWRYREVYEQGRTKYADAIHTTECKRCGPKGKPALEGSPLSAAHQHARAIRLICKAILRDLWQESKRIHEGLADEQHS